jgi:hypothetical protein
VRVHLAAEHALELKAAHVRFQALRVALDVLRGGFIGLLHGQLEKLSGIADALGGALDLADVAAQPGALATKLLGTGGVRPDGRILQLARDFLEPLLLSVVFKETPVARPCGPRGLSAGV